MNTRPPIRAGHGNRRRRPPAQAAARRHARWLLVQLRRLGLALVRLPQQLRARISGRISLRDTFGRVRSTVGERGRALAPVAQRTFADLGKHVGHGATASGRGLRTLGHHAGVGMLRLGRLLRLAGLRLGTLLRLASRTLLRGTLRLADATGRLTVFIGAWLWRNRIHLTALGARGLWWGALALLWYGGRALLAVDAPLAATALPLFLLGVGLCLPLFFAHAARIRWAGLALGLGHAALAVLVWSVAPGA